MTLGEKLKQARLEAGLSQRQLCGNHMTRNMLSQLENGSARPSMATLEYLARQLGKPISWFLEEASLSNPALEEARAALAKGDLSGLRRSLDDAREMTEESRLLEFLWHLQAGETAYRQQRLPYARELLGKALEMEGLYITAPLRYRCRVLLTLAGDTAPLEADEEALLARAALASTPERQLEILAACDHTNTNPWRFAAAQALFAARRYREAFDLYRQLPLNRRICQCLEDCCRELGEYKGAYEYARRLREMEDLHG